MDKNEEIREEIGKLVLDTLKHANDLPKDSDEFKKTVEDCRKLYGGIYLEQAKADCEYDEAYQRRVEEFKRRKEDNEHRDRQLAQQHKEFIQKLTADCVTNGVRFVILAIIGRWTAITESGGVITTIQAKNLIREGLKILDFKK